MKSLARRLPSPAHRWIACLLLPAALLACEDKSTPQPTADTASKPVATAADKPKPTAEPSAEAKADPSGEPSAAPTADPTAEATAEAVAKVDSNDTKPSGTPKGDPTPDSTAPAKVEPTAKPTAEKPVAVVKGKKQAEAMYSAWLQSSGKYTVGKPGSVQAVVAAAGEYKCNDKYPYKFKLNAAPAGVSFPSNIARNASKNPKQTVVSVPFTPTSAGSKTISGTFYFSVCNDATCKITKRPLSVTINVSEADAS